MNTTSHNISNIKRSKVMTSKMKNLLGTALVALVPTSAMASSHREAPAISQDPTADNTDVYAWVTPTTHDKLIVLANYIPLEEPAGGPNFNSFSDDVLYEVHIYKGDNLQRDFVTYQINFNTSHVRGNPGGDPTDSFGSAVGNGINFFSQISGDSQTYSVVRIAQNGQRTVLANNVAVAPPNIGPRTDAITHAGAAAYDDAFAATFIKNTSDGGRVFAGPRDDGFYVDLGGIFDLANILPSGRTTPTDGVAGFNTHTIALEIPLTTIFSTLPSTPGINSTLGVWAGASRRKVTLLKNNGDKETSGPFQQVSRLGLPLINEAVIGLQDKDRWNALEPKDDGAKFIGYFDNPVIVRDADVVGIYTALGVGGSALANLKTGRATSILNTLSLNGDNSHQFTQLGDVLRVDCATDSKFPNGRALQNGAGTTAAANQETVDVTDVLLSFLLTGQLTGVSDNVNHNDKNFLATFPFLAAPFQGFDQGHGKPAP